MFVYSYPYYTYAFILRMMPLARSLPSLASMIKLIAVHQEAAMWLCLLFSLSKSHSMVYSAVIQNTSMPQVDGMYQIFNKLASFLQKLRSCRGVATWRPVPAASNEWSVSYA